MKNNQTHTLSIILFILTIIFITLVNNNEINGQENSNSSLNIAEGIASGDVTDNSAIIWSRVNAPSFMNVEFADNPLFVNSKLETKWVDNSSDYTGNIKVKNLTSVTTYFYRVFFSTLDNINSSSVTGSFKTAPKPNESIGSISFIVGGDLGGQTFCRDINNGYSIFEQMKKFSPDFYIQNGDMIYADDTCPIQKPDGGRNIQGNFLGIADPQVNWNNLTQIQDIYLEHWIYNMADPHLQNFLKNTSMYTQWDDHEVINDYGANWKYWNIDHQNRTGFKNLIHEGRTTFFNFSPIDKTNLEDPDMIYRSFSWGNNLDLLILDARSDRSRNDIPDTLENNKTMLGAEQLLWLKDNLLNSNATWKVISSDVPISIPTGSNSSLFGRDGWANGITLDFSSKTGFERELKNIMKFIDDNNIKNVVFVTTDVHFPIILKYNIDMNNDGDSVNVYEIVSGPLSAFPSGILSAPLLMPDPTFEPTIYYVEGGIFNFAYIQIIEDIDGKSHMLIDIIGEDGIPRVNSHLDIVAQ
ncbi:MAG: alkaline phosphatase D family protein [Nitrososphaeraceae archaeon]